MNTVIWNNEMDICVGLSSEMDKDKFIVEAKRTHAQLTGESLDMTNCFILKNQVCWFITVWILKYV